MSSNSNILFMRLAGPMQSWGTSSRSQLRRTDLYPSKSGVLGILLCAMGVRRESSSQALEQLTPLLMGVRVDRGGILDWDYHTAGAKIGIRRADGKEPKRTSSTGEYEILLSRRQYLYDASFLVALQGDAVTIDTCAEALINPVWPLFLGRKCCIPAEPIFAGTGSFNTLQEALSSVPWRPRIDAIDCPDKKTVRTLEIYTEHPPGLQVPVGARIVYDIPRVFGFFGYAPRLVVKGQVTVSVAKASQTLQAEPHTYKRGRTSPTAKANRLKLDHHLCVFCKSPAVEVHHVTYETFGHEDDSALRSVCKLCHDACTILEYGHDMKMHRVDPSDLAFRSRILDQIRLLLQEQCIGQRRRLLRSARTSSDITYAPGIEEEVE